jgi:hypothetical protein
METHLDSRRRGNGGRVLKRFTFRPVADDRMNYLSRTVWAWSTAFGLIVLGSIAGCDQASERTSVSGKVTFDGEPVKSGQIAFEPVSGGRLGIAQIIDGVYKMPADQGPTPGQYIVRITALRPTGKKVSAGRTTGDQTQVEQFEQFIPAKYNDLSELKTEIGVEAEVQHNFDLTSA